MYYRAQSNLHNCLFAMTRVGEFATSSLPKIRGKEGIRATHPCIENTKLSLVHSWGKQMNIYWDALRSF